MTDTAHGTREDFNWAEPRPESRSSAVTETRAPANDAMRSSPLMYSKSSAAMSHAFPAYLPAAPVVDNRLSDALDAYIRMKGLSQREGEVFTRFVLEGKASKEIAGELGISYSTVKLYWTRICKKLNADSAMSAVLTFLRQSMQQCPRCGAEHLAHVAAGRS